MAKLADDFLPKPQILRPWSSVRFAVRHPREVIGFIVTFVIGGMTGVLLAMPPADFVLHESLFQVAHFQMLTKSALPGARRADVTGFGVPEHHGDGSAL